MTIDEVPDLVERLSALADGTAPASRVSAAAAIRGGRGRLRRRRLAAGALGGAALVAAALLLVPSGRHPSSLVVPAVPSSTPSPGGSPTPGGSAPVPPGGPDQPLTAGYMPAGSHDPTRYVPATGSDPLVVEAVFGRLPDWAKYPGGLDYESTYEGGAFAQVKSPTDPSAPRLLLSVLPAGSTATSPATMDGLAATFQPAAPVGGRPAYWVSPGSAPGSATGSSSGDLRLRWQLPSGRWAELLGYPLKAQNRDDLLRVAADVQGVPTQVPLPVWYAGLPADVKLNYVTLERSAGAAGGDWNVQLIFWSGAGSTSSVTVRPDGTGTDPSGAACRSDQGVRLCVGGDPGDPALSGLLLAHLHTTGAADGDWTTQVQR
ncbi:hypothetical protein ACFYNO_05185 [Kitasatospora sp. NPDC006697]|uniref:hypothetical protein n=1 Tax=Kitasatospora sp. NPDC006697 TaxID=3364020 RepID=UPI0036A10BF8